MHVSKSSFRLNSSSAALLGVVGLFLIVRLITLSRTFFVEDHDSILYLSIIAAWAGRIPSDIVSWSPDITPFYPLLGAALARLGLATELAARSASLLLATVGFLAAMAIAYRYYGPRLAALAGLLLALSPFIVPLDISVLTEPSYAGLVYLGLFLYLRRAGDSSSLWYAIPVGVVIGLTFLTRTEGLLFLLLVPALHVAATVRAGALRRTWPRTATWCLLFMLIFSALAAPQVASVSRQMGSFAINGRQVWVALLQAPGTARYEKRLFSLDHNPATTNLHHFQADAAARATLPTSTNLLAMPGHVLHNMAFILPKRLIQVAGPALPFALLGLVIIYRRPRDHPIWLPTTFLLLAAGPALLHTLAFRHIMFLGPIFAILAAVGLFAAAGFVANLAARLNVRLATRAAALAAVAALILAPSVAYIGHRVVASPRGDDNYAPADLERVAQVIRAQHPSGDAPLIIARKMYLPYHSRSIFRALPWTDYPGLVRYAQLNAADYLYVQESTDAVFPWFAELEQTSEEFQLVHRCKVAGSNAALYRVGSKIRTARSSP